MIGEVANTATRGAGTLPTVDSGQLDRFLDGLRERGGRVTTPRRLIATAFLDAGGHVTIEDLAVTVQKADPDIAISTIYRTMEAFEEVGAVEHLHVGHGPAVYHLVDQGHHHLVCDGCGKTIEVPDATVDSFADRIRADYGFTIDARHFAMPGRCADCAT